MKLVAVLLGLLVALTACGRSAAGDSVEQPTATQAMVCQDEIKDVVKTALALKASPPTSSTFTGGKFTCAYQLPMGTMKLSVQHSPTEDAALLYLDSRRMEVGAATPLIGLTDHAYGSGTGFVLVVKDNETLEVDTTGLPVVFGTEGQKRVDLAYELASAVLGCWTGHDGT